MRPSGRADALTFRPFVSMKGAVEEALPAVKPERFGRYVLLDRIGEGGMAEVFRAVLPGAEGFKRTFVVKRILSHLSQSPRFVDMFIREARIGALLNHPNIVQVYDFGQVDGSYFLAMEYLRGRDVLAMIRRLRDMKRPFPIAVAAFIAQQVAGCLAYAHALADPDGRCLDIIHRDVSPSNVMCLRAGGVKLMDFGIAKTVDDLTENTEQGAFKGKLAYLAPERVKSERFDGRSDLYSLGVVLWEMLTCRRLFRGDSQVETFKNVLEMPIAPPSSRRPEVPASLDAVVMRAIERDPAKRYASGQAMADDLEEVLAETKFQSRQLPQLLVELFGSGVHSSQTALSSLTPELLASVGIATLNPAGTGSVRLPRWRKSWRLWAAAGTAALLITLVAALALRPGEPKAEQVLPPARPPVIASPAPVASPAPAPTAVATPPPSSTPVSDELAAKTSKPVAAKRPATARARSNGNAIARGLSIDPFAEAATRGKR